MSTLTPNPINPMFVPAPTIKTPADKGKAPTQGGSGGGGGGRDPPAAANTTVTAPVDKLNGGSLRENPPKIFTGTHSKSNKFLREFRLYHLTNQRTEVMRSPVERVALALSYI
jgi:hypothetical protein